MNDDHASLHDRINSETARYPWRELQRFFASGAVVAVAPDLDLVEVAISIAKDDTVAVRQWMAEQRIGRVSDLQAQAWLEADAQLWTVVIKPWILVQQVKGH
jgi:hypothetical protein